jgi:carbon storage regulator CsrA
LVVLAVNGDRVKLGFSAPSNVAIHREEVHRRTQSEDGHTCAKTCDETSDGTRHEFREWSLPVLDS